MPGKRGKGHYTARIAARICEHIALGMTIKASLAKEPLGPSLMVFWKWLDEYPEFREKYERARLLQADMHADTMMAMAEEVLVNPHKASAFRVAVDILQWQASMRNPKMYGSKLSIETKGEKIIDPVKLKAEIAALEKELNVDKESTARSRDLNHAETQPSPNLKLVSGKPE